MYQLSHVVNSVLQRAKNEKVPITPMKLQKLLYFLYKHHIKNTGEPLFAERFEPWEYGPVLTDVYATFKSFRANPITTYYKDGDGKFRCVHLPDSKDFKDTVDFIWGKYGGCSGIQLSKLTHKEDGAWMNAVNNGAVYLSDKAIFDEPYYPVEDE